LNNGLAVVADVFSAIARHGFVFLRLVEGPDLELERAFDCHQTAHRTRLRLGDGVLYGLLDTHGHLVAGEREVVRGAGGALKEAGDSAQVIFQFLRGQSIKRRRTHAWPARADGVSGMIEDQRAAFLRRIAEEQYRQLGIERPGRTHEFVARTDPINLAVLEQHPAVLDGEIYWVGPRMALTMARWTRRVKVS